MALEFLPETPAEGLTIRFDVAGLAALLETLHEAMELGERTIGGGVSPAAAGAVKFVFAERRDPRPAAPAPARPRALEPAN